MVPCLNQVSPNIILFNPDEWRADCTGCYGDPTVQTPSLDALAARGVRFDQCHAQHPVCSPSRCSFMTGWYPHVRGHRTLWHLLSPDEPNLLRYLTQAGYDVRWYGKNDLLAPECFASSVAEAGTASSSSFAPHVNPWPAGDPRRMSFLFAPGGDPRDHQDYANVQRGIEFLRQPRDRPFCLYLPLTMPHCPYTAPKPYRHMYDPDALPPLLPTVGGKPSFYRRIRETRRLDEVDDRTLREIRAVYLGMISYSDWLLGELLRTLDETGLSENTIVIAFSDHGDWAGDYGLVEKWPSALDDTITRVPFVVAGHGIARGHTVREVTELFDLTPTVLELAGIQPRHTVQARSLVPQLRGAAGDRDRAAFAEGGYDPHEPHCFEGRPDRDAFARDPNNIYFPKGALQQAEPATVCRAMMVRTGSHKLIRRAADRSELYDLVADPTELRNLYDDPTHAGVRAQLEARLLEWMLTTADVTPFQEYPRGFTAEWVGSRH
ncbi:MAG: DUF4976 domain-containing protein [Chloroflexota bacterium]|nr:MAG: DUF4976 domain-containing protein [Chloroflexota bacterium]